MKIHHLPVYKLPKGIKLAEPKLHEAEREFENDPSMKWFREVKKNFAEVRKTWGEVSPSTLTMRLRELFDQIIPDEMYDHIRYVGRGSTRIAFISDTNICFKFQYHDWLDQSKHEIAEALRYPDLKCFPKLFDWSEDGLCMAYEVAEEPSLDVFRRTFWQHPSWIQDKLTDYAVQGKSEGLDMLLNSDLLNDPQKESFLDLMKFNRTMYEEQRKYLEDINHIDNWGLLYREGKPVILVTDFGL